MAIRAVTGGPRARDRRISKSARQHLARVSRRHGEGSRPGSLSRYDDVLAAPRDDRRPAAPHADLHLARRSPAGSARTAALKAELFQRTGSFKPRGVLNMLATLSAEEKARGVITISAGNHAQALAYGAALEGIDAWLSCGRARARRRSRRRAATARGRPGGARARRGFRAPGASCMEETGRALVHPFDDPHRDRRPRARVGLELLEDVADADTVVVPIGGGGLISGIATAVKGAAPDVRIVGVEPELSPALHVALEAGEPVTGRAALDRRRAQRAVRRRELTARSAASSVDEIGARLRGRDRRRVPLPLRAREARLRARRRGRRRRLCWRERSTLEPAGTAVAVVSGGNVARPNGRCYPGRRMKTGIHPEYVLATVRLLLRQRVPDALDEAGAPRRDLLELPSLLHGQAEAASTRAAAWSASSAGSRRPAAPRGAAKPLLVCPRPSEVRPSSRA